MLHTTDRALKAILISCKAEVKSVRQAVTVTVSQRIWLLDLGQAEFVSESVTTFPDSMYNCTQHMMNRPRIDQFPDPRRRAGNDCEPSSCQGDASSDLSHGSGSSSCQAPRHVTGNSRPAGCVIDHRPNPRFVIPAPPDVLICEDVEGTYLYRECLYCACSARRPRTNLNSVEERNKEAC